MDPGANAKGNKANELCKTALCCVVCWEKKKWRSAKPFTFGQFVNRIAMEK